MKKLTPAKLLHEEYKQLRLWREANAADIDDLEHLLIARGGHYVSLAGKSFYKVEGAVTPPFRITWDVKRGSYSGLKAELSLCKPTKPVLEERRRWSEFYQKNGFFVIVAYTFGALEQEIIHYANLSEPEN